MSRNVSPCRRGSPRCRPRCLDASDGFSRLSEPLVSYRGLLWLVAAAFFMQALDSTVVNTAVPAMAEALEGHSRWACAPR
jgi:hypothetical protein